MTSTVGLSTVKLPKGTAPASAAAPMTAQPLFTAAVSVRGMLLQSGQQSAVQAGTGLSAGKADSTELHCACGTAACYHRNPIAEMCNS